VYPLKIAIQLSSLRQPFKQALLTASRLGARGVEINARDQVRPRQLSQSGLRQLRKMLDDLNLQVAAVQFPTRRGYDDAEDLDRRIAATAEAMQLAQSLGAEVVANHIGVVSAGEASPRRQTLVEALTLLGRHGERYGARLAATTGGQSGADLAAVLALAPEGAVGADLHPANLVRGGYSVDEAVAALRDCLLHVRAVDAVRDLAKGQGVEVSLGRGVVDIPQLVAQLDECGYTGWVTIERTGADKAVEEIGNAVEYLQNLSAE